jgi:Response regulator containing a CheY-like receiver domain and an HTH DNA-binding domain
MKANKIAIADPSPIVIAGLSALLRELSDCEVVLQSDDMHTVETRLRILRPDVLIINPAMIDFSKRRMVRSQYEDLPDMHLVALVSSYVESQILKQFHGVIELNDDKQRIKSTLQQVTVKQTGDAEMDSSMLSDREKDVLICLAKGQKNNEIAENLHISTHTVITHRKNIVRKTGIKSVSALTVYAILNNLLEQKDII